MIDDFLSALQPVIRAIETLNIPYYIGGSVASSAFGAVRATMDVDVIVRFPPSSVTQFVAQLGNDYYVDADGIAEAIRWGRSSNLIHLMTALKIDLFCVKSSPYQDLSFMRVHRLPLDSRHPAISFAFASPEDVILSKLIWFEQGKRQALQQWRDVIGIVRVQQALDVPYMQSWATLLGIGELLDQLLDEG